MTINIISSGSPALDRARIEAFEARDEMIQACLCPNGCGPMIQVPGGNDCEKCKFVYRKGYLEAP